MEAVAATWIVRHLLSIWRLLPTILTAARASCDDAYGSVWEAMVVHGTYHAFIALRCGSSILLGVEVVSVYTCVHDFGGVGRRTV